MHLTILSRLDRSGCTILLRDWYSGTTAAGSRWDHPLKHTQQAQWIADGEKKLFETDAPEGSPYQDHFDTRWFRVLSVLTFALLGLFLFILPVTILYFLEPGKEWSAGLVVMFALVFTVILSLVPRIQLETILIALATYVAIMVAFLASFQGGQCQCLVST